MTFTNKNSWREGYFQCRAGFTKVSSWNHSAENERSTLCCWGDMEVNRVQNVRTPCWPQSSPEVKVVSSKLSDLGQGRGCFPQLCCLLSYLSLITCAVRASLSAQQLQCQLEVLTSEKWAPCLWWWQHLPHGLQKPNMRIFWIILIDSLVGSTNLFWKCSH